jgi:hypothetical protein
VFEAAGYQSHRSDPRPRTAPEQQVREVESALSVLIVVLIVWTLVAIIAAAFTRTLCAAASRADAEHAEQTAQRPVGVPQHEPLSTSPDAPRLTRPKLAPH